MKQAKPATYYILKIVRRGWQDIQLHNNPADDIKHCNAKREAANHSMPITTTLGNQPGLKREDEHPKNDRGRMQVHVCTWRFLETASQWHEILRRKCHRGHSNYG